MTRIVHIGPAGAGIRFYSQQIDRIYAQLGYEVDTVAVESDHITEALEHIVSQPNPLCHLELGSGDTAVFELALALLKRSRRIQLVTVHDPGVVVRHPIRVPGTESRVSTVRTAAKVVRKVARRLRGDQLIRGYLTDPSVHTIYLRPDLASGLRSSYLPHPTFQPERPDVPLTAPVPAHIGFGGYWGRGKGIETLVEAAALARRSGTDFKLTISGTAGSANDPYAKGLRHLITASDKHTSVPGFIADRDMRAFVSSLSALVLPYWPELPNGASGMAMWAGELGVPVIASRTKAIEAQLGNEGALYVDAKDPAALADAITTLLTDYPHYQEKARLAQQQIFAEHGWMAVGRALDKIVKRVQI